jgi:hypothetical protein
LNSLFRVALYLSYLGQETKEWKQKAEALDEQLTE